MTEAIKWRELTAEQRDALIHEKVMSQSLMCDTQLMVTKCHNPNISIPFYTWNCPACDYMGSGNAPPHENSHLSKLPVPYYTTSMDAAWMIVEKMKEAKWGAFCCELDGVLTGHRWDTARDKPYVTWFEQFLYSLNAEGICIAALLACGAQVDTQQP